MEVDDVMETAANGNPLGRCLSSYVDQGSNESHRYYLARRTLLEMLHDRGYVIPQSELTQSLEEFRAIHGSNPDIERLRISSACRTDPSKRVSNGSLFLGNFHFLTCCARSNLFIKLFSCVTTHESRLYIVELTAGLAVGSAVCI